MQILKSERKDAVCTEGDDTVEREREGGAADDDGACGDLCNCICGAIWRSW